MGTFAATANVNYRLLFADQGNQTSVLRFCLYQTNRSFPFLFAANKQNFSIFVFCLLRTNGICCLFTENGELYIYIYMLSFYEKIYRKIRRPGSFPWSVYHLLILQTVVCRLSTCWRRNKRKLPIYKRNKWNKQTCPSMLKSNKLSKQPRQHFPHAHNSGIKCSRSRRRAANGSKRMYLDYTHGLFIT